MSQFYVYEDKELKLDHKEEALAYAKALANLWRTETSVFLCRANGSATYLVSVRPDKEPVFAMEHANDIYNCLDAD
jgi:hypothetical protein